MLVIREIGADARGSGCPNRGLGSGVVKVFPVPSSTKGKALGDLAAFHWRVAGYGVPGTKQISPPINARNGP